MNNHALTNSRDRTIEITMRTIFATTEDYERAINVFHAIEGGNQTLARLAAYLLELPV